MRRIDKKLNMLKVNLLAESRYLESKGLVKESTDVVKKLQMIKKEFEKLKPNFTLNNDALKINSLKLEITYDLKDETYKIINDKGEQYFNKIGRFSECTDCKFRELADVIEFIKSEEKKLNETMIPVSFDSGEHTTAFAENEDGFSLSEMDYKRVIDNKDFDFLNKQEFNGWGYEEIEDSKFKITNKEYPNFEFIVSLNKGKHSNAGKYPWNYEAKHTGGRNLPTSGHQGVYTIERNATSDLENTLLKFINSKEKKLNETMLPIIDNFGDRKIAFAENEDDLEEGISNRTVNKVKKGLNKVGDVGKKIVGIETKDELIKKQAAFADIDKFDFEAKLFIENIGNNVPTVDDYNRIIKNAIQEMPKVKELDYTLFMLHGTDYFLDAKVNGKDGKIPSSFFMIVKQNEFNNYDARERLKAYLNLG